jgi:hypothetical protein
MRAVKQKGNCVFKFKERALIGIEYAWREFDANVVGELCALHAMGLLGVDYYKVARTKMIFLTVDPYVRVYVDGVQEFNIIVIMISLRRQFGRGIQGTYAHIKAMYPAFYAVDRERRLGKTVHVFSPIVKI